MAQQITFWKMEGESDVELATHRLKTKADITTVMTKMPLDCDVATLDRTDRQSHITHIIWAHNRYVDLNDRLKK